MTERHRRISDVHILLVRDGGRVLLSRRRGGCAAGLWHVPSGHLEADEHTAAGAAREAEEELGVRVDARELEFVHFIDHRAPGEDPRLGVFYRPAPGPALRTTVNPTSATASTGSRWTAPRVPASPTTPPR